MTNQHNDLREEGKEIKDEFIEYMDLYNVMVHPGYVKDVWEWIEKNVIFKFKSQLSEAHKQIEALSDVALRNDELTESLEKAHKEIERLRCYEKLNEAKRLIIQNLESDLEKAHNEIEELRGLYEYHLSLIKSLEAVDTAKSKEIEGLKARIKELEA